MISILQLKDIDWKTGLKNKIQLYVASKNTDTIKEIQTEGEKVENDIQCKCNPKANRSITLIPTSQNSSQNSSQSHYIVVNRTI